jgi:hypothetical protein
VSGTVSEQVDVQDIRESIRGQILSLAKQVAVERQEEREREIEARKRAEEVRARGGFTVNQAVESLEDALGNLEDARARVAYAAQNFPATRRLQRLEELFHELDTDPELFRFVDSFVGQRVHQAEERQRAAFEALWDRQRRAFVEAEQRQRAESQAAERRQNMAAMRLTAISSVISLVAGWLLSLTAPSTVLVHLVGR